MFDIRTKLFFFACLKGAAGVGAPALSSDLQKIGSGYEAFRNVAAPGGSGSETLVKVCKKVYWLPTLEAKFHRTLQDRSLLTSGAFTNISFFVSIEEETDRREGKRSSLLFGECTVLDCRTRHLAARMIWRFFFGWTSILGGWWFGVNQMIIRFLKHPFCQASVLLLGLFFISSWR